ncbi:MAG: hypothetical protein KDK91_07930 [Gammaproteobacteria bacterium]|nr:hypothetical protein [Gammaproteobacteria bacterium]
MMIRTASPRWPAVMVALMLAVSGPQVQAQRSTPVTVVNPDSDPVPVAPAGIAGVPVQGSTILVVPAGEFSDTEPLIEPPAGSMLIIEYLTVAIDSRNPQEQGVVGLRTSVAGTSILHRLGPIPPLLQTGLGSGRGQEFQRNVRLYSDATVQAVYQRGTGFDTERAIVQVTFSGRLVPLP